MYGTDRKGTNRKKLLSKHRIMNFIKSIKNPAMMENLFFFHALKKTKE